MSQLVSHVFSGGVTLGTVQIPLLLFADDIVLLDFCPVSSNKKIAADFLKDIGCELNASKTKVETSP